jgi:hypothetical protein
MELLRNSKFFAWRPMCGGRLDQNEEFGNTRMGGQLGKPMLSNAFGVHGERLMAGGPGWRRRPWSFGEGRPCRWTFHDNDANRLLTGKGQDEGGFRA